MSHEVIALRAPKQAAASRATERSTRCLSGLQIGYCQPSRVLVQRCDLASIRTELTSLGSQLVESLPAPGLLELDETNRAFIDDCRRESGCRRCCTPEQLAVRPGHELAGCRIQHERAVLAGYSDERAILRPPEVFDRRCARIGQLQYRARCHVDDTRGCASLCHRHP